MSIKVNTSARHAHLSQEHIEILFGKGAQLTHKKDLMQPGQYACDERITIVGPKKEIANVIVLGPARPASQVEISYTDARSLGLEPFLRESGDLDGTAGCTLVGPCGSVELTQGVIVAKRHIHMPPADAEKFGVADREIVCVKLITEGRSAILCDVVVRVSDKFALEMHIDTDESNATCAVCGIEGVIISPCSVK